MNQDKATEKLAGVKYAGMKATHTPGPWFLSAHYVRHRQSDGTKPNIASLECFGGPLPEGDANAFLIAAAPDLLARLRECVDYLYAEADNAEDRNNGLIAECEAIIRKATDGDE